MYHNLFSRETFRYFDFETGEEKALPPEGVAQTEFGRIYGLPQPVEGHFYIVSELVFLVAKSKGRRDVCTPNVVDGSSQKNGRRVYAESMFQF
jgi:hypothetical protein